MTSVPSSGFFNRAGLDMASLRERAERLQSQVATGQRLLHGSEDPVAASLLRDLGRADARSDAHLANANAAMLDLQKADAALGQIADNILRARELATQAANGTLNDTQRTAIANELDAIRETIIALANSEDGAGHALFGGQGAGPAYTIDGLGNAVYAGTASAGEVPVAEGQSILRSVTGPEAFDFDHNGSPTDLMAVLAALSQALSGGSPDPVAAARDGIDALGAGLDKLTSAQTLVGARMNWVEQVMDWHVRDGELRAGEEAELGGADLAGTITELQRIMTVLEASQASFVRLSSLTLFDALR